MCLKKERFPMLICYTCGFFFFLGICWEPLSLYLSILLIALMSENINAKVTSHAFRLSISSLTVNHLPLTPYLWLGQSTIIYWLLHMQPLTIFHGVPDYICAYWSKSRVLSIDASIRGINIYEYYLGSWNGGTHTLPLSWSLTCQEKNQLFHVP